MHTRRALVFGERENGEKRAGARDEESTNGTKRKQDHSFKGQKVQITRILMSARQMVTVRHSSGFGHTRTGEAIRSVCSMFVQRTRYLCKSTN